MSDESVIFAVTEEGVATVTLDRPQVRNAFDETVIERLADVFEDIAVSDGIRVALIEAVGTSFSAGADLNWMRRAADFDEDDNLEDARALGAMLHRLYSLPKPTVALVQGSAYGGGAGLIAACDMAITVADARFAFSEVRLGIVPAVISPYVIGAIGRRAAGRYMVSGERFDAAEARRIGLVHEVVADAQALNAAGERLVDTLLKAAPGAIAETKDLIDAVADRPIDAHLIDDTARRIARVRTGEEGREGVAAFLEKRKPRWAR